ncbi:MAG: acyl-CoA thioesterase, partial [Muribaculaceae bacterium]|nr:acyl-CoA thioesterase [Muribaculaceae bacterium]
MDSNDTPKFHDSVDIQMRFKDVDLFGHVNNTVYFEYMDLGKVHYIENVLGDIF